MTARRPMIAGMKVPRRLTIFEMALGGANAGTVLGYLARSAYYGDGVPWIIFGNLAWVLYFTLRAGEHARNREFIRNIASVRFFDADGNYIPDHPENFERGRPRTVPSVGAKRRAQALRAAGWNLAEIAAEAGGSVTPDERAAQIQARLDEVAAWHQTANQSFEGWNEFARAVDTARADALSDLAFLLAERKTLLERVGQRECYEPCVLGEDGKCSRWSHNHGAQS